MELAAVVTCQIYGCLNDGSWLMVAPTWYGNVVDMDDIDLIWLCQECYDDCATPGIGLLG